MSRRRRIFRGGGAGAGGDVIDPTIGEISDYLIDIVAGEVVQTFTPATNASSHQQQIGLLDPPTDGEVQTLDDPVELESVTQYRGRVRGQTIVGVGPWSNVDDFTTPDTDAPLIASTNLDGISRFAPTFIWTADEAITLGAVGIVELRLASDNSLIDSWNLAADGGSGAGQFELIGQAIHWHATDTTPDWGAATDYYFIAPEETFKDAADNPFLGLSDPADLAFTTLAAGSVAASDIMGHRISSSTASVTHPTSLTNSSGLTPGPLVPVAEQFLLLVASARNTGSSGTGALVTQAAELEADGWTVEYFNTLAIGGGEDRDAMLIAWKIADGTEDDDEISLFVLSGAAGTIANNARSIIASYNITGRPRFQNLQSQMTINDPTAQVIPCAAEAIVPQLAFSVGFGPGASAAATEQTFTGASADQNVVEGATGTGGTFLRLKTKIFNASPADITTDIGDLGASANGLLSGIFVFG